MHQYEGYSRLQISRRARPVKTASWSFTAPPTRPAAACKEAIEKAISEHYCDNVLHREAVAQVAEQFGHERILYVLAITIRQKDWDGRFSADNKQWAKTVPVAENPDAWGTDRNCYLAVNSHSGWLTCLPSWRGRTQGA